LAALAFKFVKLSLCVHVSLFCGFMQPFNGKTIILLNAFAYKIRIAQKRLSGRKAFSGKLFQLGNCFIEFILAIENFCFFK